MLETGAVGVIGVAVLMLVPLDHAPARGRYRRQRDDPRYGLLGFAIVVSGAGYTAALFFYDAFGFYQTFFVLCMLLAVARVADHSEPARRSAREPSGRRRDARAGTGGRMTPRA